MGKLETGQRIMSERAGSYGAETAELMAAIRLERGRARTLRAQADEIDRLVDNLVRLLAVSDQSQRPPPHARAPGERLDRHQSDRHLTT
jgi:hypothetical protein